ncbi:hypothetical protein F4820DRAFT_471977 [Hypoxylon rubiginosum]|uniref:Uncharacterized protein n=1 Tax=Hypoxylon rubiginosum TaxID=110542 RepID=A0ACB9YUS9_9PEZI|nr:hypothetical protein F4820DRAFT_471977 [Hypoxylon rubiginosum]
MAFTAVHYPNNKDQGQLPYWPDSEELGVAAENFFDQFVTFDATDPAVLGGDLVENPPSPSILLEDTLNGVLTNTSSNDQDTQSGQSQNDQSQSDVAIASALLDLPPSISSSEASIPDHSQSVPPELTTPLFADPVLSGGSISDSELLRLEGISIKSPKPNATAPSTPPFPATSTQAPRKHSRVLDSIYATFRRATHRSKPQKPQDHSQMDTDGPATLADAFKKEGNTFDIPGGLDWKDFEDIKLEEMPLPVDDLGLPLSPPLTGRIPPDQHSSSAMDFVNGHFDDPFVDDLLGPPAVIHADPKSLDINLNTPMATPGLNDDPFYQNSLGVIDTNGHSFRSRPLPKQRSTSSAEWPMEGILTNDNTSAVWPSSSPGTGPVFVPDSPEWWDTAATPHTKGHHHRYHNGMHGNVALNLSMHNQQAELPYEYANNADLSGLMIHMPQPRAPQAAVLSPGMHDVLMSPATHYYPTPSSGHRHSSSSHHRSSSHHHGERRPRPRAPSSGARHHGSLTSPRKMSSCYALREESMSPTPQHPRHRSASSSSSAALTVRKRRSWTRRSQQQQEPRTPSARSVSYEGGHHGHGSSSRRGSGGRHEDGGGEMSGGGGGGGGAFSIEFCNYTPNDKKVLMNGVAPSGSSKTKARREKEAMEHKRQMSEAYIQAIRAAGGDVEKLRQNGFFEQDNSD